MQYRQGNKAILRISTLLLAAAAWAIPNLLQASLIIPREPPLDFEAMLDTSVAETASGSSSSASDSVKSVRNSENLPKGSPEDSDRPNQRLFVLPLTSSAGWSLGGLGSGSSTSSTTSSTGTGGSFSPPLDSSAASLSLFDSERVSWVCGERHFSLPTPLANDLLRPPQA